MNSTDRVKALSVLVTSFMDDFLSEIDKAISNIGIDKFWYRTVGGHKIKFSPISYESQLKINELIQSSDLGSALLSESKRVTLSYAIVGINDSDFSAYRNSPPRFPIKDRDGKTVNVSIDKYLYHKIGNWDSQFVDDCFSVFADLMSSHVKDNLKDIKFENNREPLEEMNELIIRVAELRDRLGLPHLIDPIREPEKLRVEPNEEFSTPEPIDDLEADIDIKPIHLDGLSTKVDEPKFNEPVELKLNSPIDEIPESIFNRKPDPSFSSDNPYVPKTNSFEPLESNVVKTNPGDIKIDKVPENRNPRFSQSR